MKVALMAAAAAGLLTFATSPAVAHDDAYLATQKAPNGGQLRMAGPYHYELVVPHLGSAANAGGLVVYVTDHAGTPVPTQGAQGVAHVLVGKERSTLKLAPDGENRMRAGGAYDRASEAKIVVSITMAGARPEQARFASDPSGGPVATEGMRSGDGEGHGH